MTRNELNLIMDKAQTRQQLINLSFGHLYGACLKAVECGDYLVIMGILNRALETIDKDLEI